MGPLAKDVPLIRPSPFTSNFLLATYSPTSHPRLASIATRPCVISDSLQRLTSCIEVALFNRLRGSNMSGNGWLIPGRVFASVRQPLLRLVHLLGIDWQSLPVRKTFIYPNHARLRYRQPLKALYSKMYDKLNRWIRKPSHSHLMMSPGTTSLSGAVDALGAIVRKTLFVLNGCAGRCSLEGIEEVALQLLCAVTLIADILGAVMPDIFDRSGN